MPILLQVIKFLCRWLKLWEMQNHVVHMNITMSNVHFANHSQPFAELMHDELNLFLFQLVFNSIIGDQVEKVLSIAILSHNDTSSILKLQQFNQLKTILSHSFDFL